MSAGTKAVSYGSALLGMALGVATGYVIYTRTAARARVLEAEEAAAAQQSGRRTSVGGTDYVDDDDDDDDNTQEARNTLRGRDDDMSLHTVAYEDDLESGYRDEYTDDEDALERDPFDEGDGPESEAGSQKGKE